MNRPVALAALTAVSTLALIGVGCQTYDFEPVTPMTLAQTTQVEARFSKILRPNVMLLIDKSGSMNDPISSQSGAPTKMQELRTALGGFLGTSGTVARFGLTFYPNVGGVDGSCRAPGAADIANPRPEVPIPSPSATDVGTEAALAANSAEVSRLVGLVGPGGGTPTGAALAFMGTLAGLQDPNDGRDDYVLLLTDGLPNCNKSNPNNLCSGANPLCRCTGNCSGTGATLPCASGCLDEDNTVAQVVALRAKGIKTIVVGFGADTGSGDGPAVLQAMGEAGGLAPRCPKGTDAECGAGNTCDVVRSACNKKYFQAANSAQLADILTIVVPGAAEPCLFLLNDRPSDPRFVAVLVEGENVPQGADTWSYSESNGSVTFSESSSYCAALKASTPSSPVNVEIRIIQRL